MTIFMLHSLTVILCIVSLTSSSLYRCHKLNNTGTLIVLMRVAIQVVYCHTMVTPFVECLWNVICCHFCLKQSQLIEQTKDKLWQRNFGTADSCLDSNQLYYEEEPGPVCLVLVSLKAGRCTIIL